MIKLTQGQLPAGQGATYNAPMTLNIFVQDASKFQTITAVVQAGEVKEIGEEKKEYSKPTEMLPAMRLAENQEQILKLSFNQKFLNSWKNNFQLVNLKLFNNQLKEET